MKTKRHLDNERRFNRINLGAALAFMALAAAFLFLPAVLAERGRASRSVTVRSGGQPPITAAISSKPTPPIMPLEKKETAVSGPGSSLSKVSTSSSEAVSQNGHQDKSGFYETSPVLMYHYVEKVPAKTSLPGLYLDPKIFSGQLSTLEKNGYKTVFVSEVASALSARHDLGGRDIALTFDDGYEDFYTEVFPILKEHGAKATVYVIINALDKPGYLTKAQVKELAASGLVEVGSHTFNHLDLRKLKPKDALFEIVSSRAALERISGQPVVSFAYPYGYHDDALLELASSTYTSAASVLPGLENGEGDRFLLRRLRPDARQGQALLDWLSGWGAGR